MDRLPYPERSRAVLIGASSYSNLDDLPAVQANVPALRALLCGPNAPFQTENCAALVDPATTVEVSQAVQKAAREATDTLLVYYAGHGLLDDRGIYTWPSHRATTPPSTTRLSPTTGSGAPSSPPGQPAVS